MAISRRHFAQLIGAGAVGAAVAKNPAVSAQEENILRLGLAFADTQTMDPHYAAGTQDRVLVDMIYNGLVRYVPGTPDQFEADLAEEVPEGVVNDDGTQTWSFKLREGVMTHAAEGVDSVELTVDDLLFSYSKSADPNTSAYAGDYLGWVFEFNEETGTFDITIPAPLSPFLFLPKVANYSGGYVIPRHAYETIGADNFITNPVGTGPFAFKEHVPQLRVDLVAHKDFFRGTPKLDGVTVHWQSDPTARENGLMAGDYDMITGQSDASWAARIGESEGLTTDIFGMGEAQWMNLNIEHEILSDIRVREAIIKAVNSDSYVAMYGEPVGGQLASVTPSQLPGGLTVEEAEAAGVYYRQDIEGAKALLAEAGYPDGFEMDLIASEADAYRIASEILQEELRQIGITVTLEVVQHATMHELIREGRNPITIYSAYRPSADTYLTQFWTEEGGVTNFSTFKLDDLRDRARAETDDDAQAELWREANIEILKNFAGFGFSIINIVYVRRNEIDYGHEVIATPHGYPGITENTTISRGD